MENSRSTQHFKQGLFLALVMVLLSISQAAYLRSFGVYNYLSIQGPNSTTGYNTVMCGQPPTPQPNQFGQVFCFDMPLLASKSLSSKLIGRVQGTFVFAQQTGGIVFVSETFRINNTFPIGEFTGVGLEHLRQISSKPIVGGIGAYAPYRGTATTYPLNLGYDSNNNFFTWFKYTFVFTAA